MLLSLEPSRPVLRATLRIAVIAAVIGAIAFVAAGQVGRLSDAKWHFQLGWFLVAIVALVVFQINSSVAWALMMRWLRSPVHPWVRAWSVWNVSLLARYVPTNALLVVTRVNLAERAGAQKRVTLASVVYEIGLTFTASLVVGAYFVTRLQELQPYWWRYAAFVLPVAALVALHPRVFHPIADAVFSRLGRPPLAVTLGLPKVASLIAIYAAGLVVAGVAVYALVRCVHGVDAGETPAVLASYSVGYALSIVGFFLPGGLGAREAGIVASLAGVLPVSQAIAVAVILRLVQIGVELTFAGLLPVLVVRQQRSAAPA